MKKQELEKFKEFYDHVTSEITEENTYKNWTARKYITASELEEFINELKPKVVGKPLKKIYATGNLFDYLYYKKLSEHNGKYYMFAEWCGTDENGKPILNYRDCDIVEKSEIHIPNGTWEEYSVELDEPIILQIGNDIQLEVDFQEHSLAQIGVNSLKEKTFVSYQTGKSEWDDISGFYSKNLIGHTIKDIYISKTKQASVSWQVKRENGDDMYDEIGLVFDNGYKLVFEISSAPDYMLVSEVVGK